MTEQLASVLAQETLSFFASLFGSLEFREPMFALVAIVILPVLWIRVRRRGKVIFSSLSLLPAQTSTWRTRLSWVPDACIALAIAAFAIALTGPRQPDESTLVKRKGIAIMMVVDTSGSMAALDLSTSERERTRLDAVKDVFRSFVEGDGGESGRPNDAIGLVSFARYADSLCPLTLDHNSLMGIVESLSITTKASENRTNIGDGLALAVDRLRDSKSVSKIVILLTDGVNNAGQESPLTAAALAKEYGIRVYTIGAGTSGYAPIRQRHPLTGEMVLQQTPVQIDEATLGAIAEQTGGKYFRATDADSLIKVYGQIDSLERTELEDRRYGQYREFSTGAVASALILALLAALLSATVWRRLPC